MNIDKHELCILIKRTPETQHIPSKRIHCVDGVSLSVQASEYTYCLPQENFLDEYTHVEVGFIQQGEDLFDPPELEEYSDGEDVYGYVPVELVVDFINKHGGVVLKKYIDSTCEILNKLKLSKG